VIKNGSLGCRLVGGDTLVVPLVFYLAIRAARPLRRRWHRCGAPPIA